MTMKLDKVVPFGRSLDEYIKMFNLKPIDLQKKIISVADGTASFNAEATLKGSKIISVDPIYQLTGEEIQHRFNQVVDNIIEQVKATPNDWVWSYHKSPDNLYQNRVKTINKFLIDYEDGQQNNRYQIGELPTLNYQDNEFDLALCSHFLFLYSEHFDENFHDKSIRELLRISKEVRIFPLLTLMLDYSPYLNHLINIYKWEGYHIKIEKVEYELQKGGNEMLIIAVDS